MAGIEDLIKVYRGDSRYFDGKNFQSKDDAIKDMVGDDSKRARTSGRFYTTDKNQAKTYSNLKKGSGLAGARKLKEAVISKADFEKGNKLLYKALTGETLKQVKDMQGIRSKDLILLPKKNLKDVKVLESTLYNQDGLDTKKGTVRLNSENLKKNFLKTLQSNVKAYTPLALKGLEKLASAPAAFVVSFLDPTVANADEVNMKLEDFAKLRKMEGMMDKALPSKPKDI
tara:strand:+ start:41 stop:724 length:684 start_codon:yes stop_codon:yes gene_type:complete